MLLACGGDPLPLVKDGAELLTDQEQQELEIHHRFLLLDHDKAIRFGRSNAWHFDLSRQHPYSFAFEYWVLDANGFPIRSRLEE